MNSSLICRIIIILIVIAVVVYSGVVTFPYYLMVMKGGDIPQIIVFNVGILLVILLILKLTIKK